jgi:hypothetical protein
MIMLMMRSKGTACSRRRMIYRLMDSSPGSVKEERRE